MRELRGEEGAGRSRPTSGDGAALLTFLSTRHPDAALGLLLGVRRAWGPLLPLGIRIWAPNWTQMFNKHWLDLPLQRNCVRLSPYSLPPPPPLYPVLCTLPLPTCLSLVDLETWAGLAFETPSSTWAKKNPFANHLRRVEGRWGRAGHFA